MRAAARHCRGKHVQSEQAHWHRNSCRTLIDLWNAIWVLFCCVRFLIVWLLTVSWSSVSSSCLLFYYYLLSFCILVLMVVVADVGTDAGSISCCQHPSADAERGGPLRLPAGRWTSISLVVNNDRYLWGWSFILEVNHDRYWLNHDRYWLIMIDTG